MSSTLIISIGVTISKVFCYVFGKLVCNKKEKPGNIINNNSNNNNNTHNKTNNNDIKVNN